MIKALDLCCGAGGWAVAARGLPIEIVMAVDWWEPACRTYKLNHPATQVIRADLKAPPFDAAALRGKIDLILGGIPCEWLSSYRNWTAASSVKPEEIDRERQLLDQVLALVKMIDPVYWCLEDVKGLVKELPPLTPWQEIDSGDYSAQRRKRVYVGSFPPPRPTIGGRAVLADAIRPGPYRIGTRLLGRTPQRARTFAADVCLGAWLNRKAPTICDFGSRRDGELAIVDPAVPGGIRQLEWQEAARLQGYPLDYLFYGSPTDVGKMVGRSVQIDTGRAILESIASSWQTAKAGGESRCA